MQEKNAYFHFFVYWRVILVKRAPLAVLANRLTRTEGTQPENNCADRR
jgi:hypothetical protein